LNIREGLKQGGLFSRERAAGGERADFESLYRQWAAPVYRYLCARLQNSTDAEDVTSQVFISVYQGLGKYQERQNFAGWIFTIARNRLVDWQRRDRHEFNLYEVDEPALETDFLSSLARQEDAARLRGLIGRLTEEEQELIRLRYVADLGFAEIAQVLQRTEGAVKKTLYRLQERLFEQMEGSHD
jgi:RNA polymerase sigma factor (sigma-70 family)